MTGRFLVFTVNGWRCHLLKQERIETIMSGGLECSDFEMSMSLAREYQKAGGDTDMALRGEVLDGVDGKLVAMESMGTW